MTLDIRNVARDAYARLVKIEDAPFIVEMRGNADNSRHLSPIVPDIQAQERWLREYKQREQAGSDYYFVLMSLDNTRIGLFRAYDIGPVNRPFTAGSWILKKNAPPHYGIASFIIGCETLFYSVGRRESVFSVSNANRSVMDFHLRNGAVITGSDIANTHFLYTRLNHEQQFRPRHLKYYIPEYDFPTLET